MNGERTIKIYADGADLETIERLAEDDLISGFTTNPSLARAAGVTDYRRFASDVLVVADGKPVSLEVFADDPDGIRNQARILSGFGDNAVIKVPVTNTRGDSMSEVVADLSSEGITVNVTAVFTRRQLGEIMDARRDDRYMIISVFAGRVADTGIDPRGHLSGFAAATVLTAIDLLWASPRQIHDVVAAERAGCDIITLTPDLLGKLPLIGKDLDEYSLETVRMFYEDAQAAGYHL